MYYEKLEPILDDLERKDVEIAGGSVVGMSLATVNSLITYIANLTLGKPKYADVQERVENAIQKASNLKELSLKAIDKDTEVLEKLLKAYKTRKEDMNNYEKACKEATDFCMDVVFLAKDTIELADEIGKIGNKMLESDFKISRYYAIASLYSAIENVYINVSSVTDEVYKNKVLTECTELLKKYRL